jgi:hypothetical protein
VAGDVRGAVQAENFALWSSLLRRARRPDAAGPGYFRFCFFAAREAGCALAAPRGACTGGGSGARRDGEAGRADDVLEDLLRGCAFLALAFLARGFFLQLAV